MAIGDMGCHKVGYGIRIGSSIPLQVCCQCQRVPTPHTAHSSVLKTRQNCFQRQHLPAGKSVVSTRLYLLAKVSSALMCPPWQNCCRRQCVPTSHSTLRSGNAKMNLHDRPGHTATAPPFNILPSPPPLPHIPLRQTFHPFAACVPSGPSPYLPRPLSLS